MSPGKPRPPAGSGPRRQRRPPAPAPAKDAPGADLDRILADLDAGRARPALRRADAALTRHPDDASLHHARGLALRDLGRPEDALLAFDAATGLAPDDAEIALDAAEVLVDEIGDELTALDVLQRVATVTDDPVVLAEAGLLRGVAMYQLRDFTGALRALDEAVRLDAENPDLPTERAAVLVELLRLEEAEQSLREALRLAEDNARAHQLLGFVLDYTGRRDEAQAAFARAAEVEEGSGEGALLPPPRLDEAAFDAAVEAALKLVPARFRKHLENVEIGVENYPTRDFCRRHDCSPTTLGLYVGTPLPLREGGEQLPDRIVLFQRGLENACADHDELVKEIGITLVHEIGHLLGYSEEELCDRGFG